MLKNQEIKSDRFTVSMFNYLHSNKKIEPTTLSHLYNSWIIGVSIDKVIFEMRNLDWEITWLGNVVFPKSWPAEKIWFDKWSKVNYFYDQINFEEPVFIVQGLLEYLSAYGHYDNLIAIPSISNLKRCLWDLKTKGVPEVWILVHNDEHSNGIVDDAFEKSRGIKLRDCRKVLWEHKTLNSYLQSNGLLPEILLN